MAVIKEPISRRAAYRLFGRYIALFRRIWKTCVPTHNRVDLWRLCTSLLYFVVRVRCRRKESSHSLFHLLMSFLFCLVFTRFICHCHYSSRCYWSHATVAFCQRFAQKVLHHYVDRLPFVRNKAGQEESRFSGETVWRPDERTHHSWES